MAMGDDDSRDDRDDRTIYVGNLSDKMTEAILYELFYQAGPIERVSIPKEKDGKIKMFGFVTYKHLPSVSYALNVFNGSKLFGRELQLRNRNANKNRDPPQSHHNQQSSSLVHGFQHFAPSYTGTDLAPVNQVLLQQQLLMLATSGQNVQSFVNAGAQMFTGASYDNNFASTRSDTAGSHREHYVERNRYHREENRSTRSKPYHRSRSRSHSPPQQRKRNRSPPDSRSRHNDKGRRTDDRSNYHRWGKR